MAVYKSTGKLPVELQDAPKMPFGTSYLWRLFLEVKGTQPLTFTELDAWTRLMGHDLNSLEIAVIKQLDRIFWDVQNG